MNRLICAGAISLLFFFPQPSWSQPVPLHMAALGDSMTAGVLAPYKRQQALYPWHHMRILWNSLQLITTGKRESMAFRQFSWSTGQKINSHAHRLLQWNPHLQSANFSQPTAYTQDVWKKQLPALQQWSVDHLQQKFPDYVTLLIGHNDLCGTEQAQPTPISQYRKIMWKSADKILSGSLRTRLLIVPIARIDTLPGNLSHSHVLPLPGLYRCENVWKTIPLCPRLTQAVDEKSKKEFKKLLDGYNDSLQELVTSMRGRYGDRIRYASTMRDYIPQPQDMAIDCFHANKEAQAMIAQKTWAATWWE